MKPAFFNVSLRAFVAKKMKKKKSKQLVVNCDAFNLTQVKAIFNSFGVKQKATFGSKHAWQAYFV